MKYAAIKISIVLLGIILFSFTTPVNKNTSGSIILNFNNLFGNEKLVLGKEYTNVHGEKLKVKTLNYFISNIEIGFQDGSIFTVEQDSSYFLIKEQEKESLSISLKNLPNKKVNSIKFLVGLDSLRNTLDISKRTGNLDIAGKARGMYWSWNSGYIFFKMEGESPVVPDSLANKYYYHIGGYGGYESKTINNIKTKLVKLESPLSLKKGIPEITIDVDVATVFNGVTPLYLSKNSNVMWGKKSVDIADNYITTFKLGSVKYKHQ